MPDLLSGANDLIGDLAGSYLLIALAGRSIGGIIPDVVVREVLVDENSVTAHPVETGAPISDHIFANPVIVEMQAGWSDSSRDGYVGRIIGIYQALLALRDTREPFDLYTGKRMYQNMVFSSISVTTDETSENALMLSARFQQVIISSTDQGASPDNQAFPQQTGPEPHVGQQSLQPVSGPLPFFASPAAGGLPAPGV